MSLRSLTTCSYVSDATCFAMRHCTIVVTPLPMSPEPESFRSRDFIMDLHGPDVGIIENGACRWWLIDGCKSLFNVKPSTVPTRLIHELYAHARTTHPERFLGAETPHGAQTTLRHLRVDPFCLYPTSRNPKSCGPLTKPNPHPMGITNANGKRRFGAAP